MAVSGVVVTRVLANTYRDSVSLMQLSAQVAEMKGVIQASIVMATEGNLDLLRAAALLETGGSKAVGARPSDLLAVVQAKTAAVAAAALDRVEAGLKTQVPVPSGEVGLIAPRSLAMAKQGAPAANLALISVPGEYAAAECAKALDAGMNVMLFSDNVALEDEIALKARANRAGLLLMGPDCGTAIIDGVPLGFANAVARGSVGCIGASGTGLQQVTCLIDRALVGISQAIGTGGRDLGDAVGGVTTLAAMKRLARDPDTAVIVLISKPPGPQVAEKVVAAAAKAGKPVVVCFIGAQPVTRAKNLYPVRTLEDAARAATALAGGRKPGAGRATSVRLAKLPRFTKSQRFVRGLYSGGTFCYEASMLLGAGLGKVWSNAPVRKEDALADPWSSIGHTVVDLGDDAFTRGRPHPMIDHRLRNERILKEARQADVAVILLDIVLGHGAHPDPAAVMLPAIRRAQALARTARRSIAFVGFICGTDRDPQGQARQAQAFRDAGVILGSSNAEAVRIAQAIARKLQQGVKA